MVNILEAQQHANKELLSEIEALKKQLADKEENLKWEIWRIGREEWGYRVEGYKYSTFKRLDDKWLEEGKITMVINPNETREWVKGCKKPCFDNITVEEMLTGFCDSSKELQLSSNKYISNWSERGYQLNEQRQEYEKKIEELNKYKEQVENLAKNVKELLSGYSELSEEDIEKERIYWQICEPEELLEKIKGNANKLNEVIMRIIEKWEIDAKTHFISFTETSKAFNDAQRKEFTKEYNDVVDLLDEANEIIENRDLQIKDLQKDLKEKSEMLDESDERNEELKRQLFLERKPLPSLPKKQNKLQKLGTKVKTKIQTLVKKVKHQEQALVARIEVKSK